MSDIEMIAIFKGRVQGVGFRAMAKFHAEQLQLCGFVSNLPDGSVKICAQGSKEKLERLINRLKKEFGSRAIEEVEITFTDLSQSFHHFQIQ